MESLNVKYGIFRSYPQWQSDNKIHLSAFKVHSDVKIRIFTKTRTPNSGRGKGKDMGKEQPCFKTLSVKQNVCSTLIHKTHMYNPILTTSPYNTEFYN